MATITVRGLGHEVVRALQLRATRHGRSLEAEVRSILSAAARSRSADAGFGTRLAVVLTGTDLPRLSTRDEYPQPLR